MPIIEKVEEEKYYECSEHGKIMHGYGSICPYCDKCEHGKMRTQHCIEGKCGDMTWATAPISRDEFDRMKIQSNNYVINRRTSPHPRQFTTVNLLHKLLAEYEVLKFGSHPEGNI
jgi:hypothetical protein